MGWGCYKHEWDAGSEKWRESADRLSNERLEKTIRADWGRDGQVCPECYRDLERSHGNAVDMLRHVLENQILPMPMKMQIRRVIRKACEVDPLLVEHESADGEVPHAA